MSIEIGTPDDMLISHPETAYFWGRVAGDGELHADRISVRTNDETAARRLAAIAGAERIDHRILEREYAHDTTITRSEDAYTVEIAGDLAERASDALGIPFANESGDYEFDAVSDNPRQLLRGLLEGCGTVCYKSSEDVVGISFVHDDERLLERIDTLLDGLSVPTPTGDRSETSSGGYWFGIDDEAAPAVGRLLYEGSESTGLFAPSRRRKLVKSLEQAER